MWDLPRPGIEPVSIALQGGFFTTEPSGKPMLFKKFRKIIRIIRKCVHFLVAEICVCKVIVLILSNGKNFQFIFDCAGSLLLHTGSSVIEASRGLLFVGCTVFSLRWLL